MPKKKPNKYAEKIQVKGTFQDVIKAAVTNVKKPVKAKK